jgi:hypothetical protein
MRIVRDRDRVLEVLEDGESIRVPLLLTDAAARFHQPGFRSVNDGTVKDARIAARDARAAYLKQLNDAWRKPPLAAGPADPKLNEPDEPDDDPDDVPGPHSEELVMHRHLFGPDDNAKLAARLERERARDFQRRSRDLQNAWRNPGRTDPGAANAIERQGERWRGGR